jgi:prepilin-type processing-associated H-X9-DG protein
MWDRQKSADEIAVEECLITPISGFQCPSDDSEDRSERTVPGLVGGLGLSNYVANNGSGRIMWKSIDKSVDSKRVTGPFHGDGTTRISQMRDGTSNTVLLSERTFRNGAMSGATSTAIQDSTPGAANIYGAKGLGHDEGSADEEKSFGMVDVAFCGSGILNNFDSFTKKKGASSRHSGGVQMAFADGSVHFISENIEQGAEYEIIANAAYKQLLSMNDGFVIGEY